MKGLKNKRVLITGGASGIGAATVSRFINEKSLVTILDCDEVALDKIKIKIPDIIGTIKGDVSNPSDIELAFNEVKELMGGIDVLINNAGISIREPFMRMSYQQWQKVLDVNLTGVFLVAQATAKLMLEGLGGVILNMASTNGIMGYPFYASYNASKAGVIELTKSIALELAPIIRVNAVCPGYILTPMQETEYTPEMLKESESKIPLKRLGKPEEVAGLFAFLASDDAKYITGQCFVIDGGEIAGGLASR
ncbi:MAG: SDR family NAD(P)-dependent oxidoreductase [Candidatus Hodarchaeales archaeon]|jgi:NAD(P)-dependent dehydrogenase (short-subunit alcohol dehydrogenase family)